MDEEQERTAVAASSVLGRRSVGPSEVGTAVLRIAFGWMLFFPYGLPNVVAVAAFLGTGVTSPCLHAVVAMGMPAPMLAATPAAAALFPGGLLVAAGLLTRPSATVLTGVRVPRSSRTSRAIETLRSRAFTHLWP
jgi:uncharacterized membrane protein YphA (DoxX/SURF4 family)